MTLVSETSLFGNQPRDLLPTPGEATLHEQVFDARRANELFDILVRDLEWSEREIRMFGRMVKQPRLVAWYGDAGRTYRYSGSSLEPLPWTAELRSIKDACETVAGVEFNSVLANLYRDGSDGVAWHADDEPELGEQPVIASVSLGAARRFDLRHRESGETVKTLLPDGSVLVMSGRSQRDWIHQVPKTSRPVGPRVNLTFRCIHE